VEDSHATSNPAISDIKRKKKNGLKRSLSLSENSQASSPLIERLKTPYYIYTINKNRRQSVISFYQPEVIKAYNVLSSVFP